MRKAALYVHGRIVIADSHLAAYHQLEIFEQREEFVSGFFNLETDEFEADCSRDHFFDKEIILIRHADPVKSNGPDPDLSSVGISKSQQTASYLSKLNLTDYVALSSPFLRCLCTSLTLHESLGIKFHIDPNLAESPEFLQENEEFPIPNRHELFPQFSWPEQDFALKRETSAEFRSRIVNLLQGLPRRSILVTHLGVICHMVKIALCEEKARLVAEQGVQPGSITHVHREDVKCLGRTVEKNHQD